MSYEYDLDAMSKNIDTMTKAIYIINPHWQIGKLLSDKRIKAIIKVAEDRGIPIIVDETYAGFVFPTRKF